MKHTLIALSLFCSLVAAGQTLYVPSGTGGIGTSTTSFVGIGTSAPNDNLMVKGTGDVGVSIATDAGTWSRPGLTFTRNASFWSIGMNSNGANTDNLMFRSSLGWPMMIQASTGFVGIGTLSPNQMLTVKGTIYGKRVLVDAAVPGPDYVFEKSYKLPALDYIRAYIEEYKHLPEVPSAKEMEADGVDVGKIDMLLLKKVEELTLYILQQEKRIKTLEEKLEEK